MVRKFKNDDLDEIMKIWLHENITVHDFISEEYWLSNLKTVREELSKTHVFVFEEKNEIQGFVGLYENYIAGIFVKDECQSKGIGTKLLNYIKKEYDELTLNVYEKNQKAISFYEKEKFVVLSKQMEKDNEEAEYTMKWESDRHSNNVQV